MFFGGNKLYFQKAKQMLVDPNLILLTIEMIDEVVLKISLDELDAGFCFGFEDAVLEYLEHDAELDLDR